MPQPPAPAPPAGPGQVSWGQPGYQPQPPAQQWANQPGRLQPTNSGLLTATTVLSVLFGAGTCALAYLAPNQHQAIKEIFDAAENGTTASTAATLAPGSDAYRAVSPLAILVEVAAWVVVCLWLSRARQNAVALRPNGQRRSEIWVWLGWIVPIVQWWFPRMIVKDTIAATADASGRPGPGVNWWWLCWLGSSLFSGLQFGCSFLEPNSTRHAVLAVIGAIVTLFAVTLWVRIVRWISAGQDALVGSESPTTLNR